MHKGWPWGHSNLPRLWSSHDKGLNSDSQTTLQLRKLQEKAAKHRMSELEAVLGIGTAKCPSPWPFLHTSNWISCLSNDLAKCFLPAIIPREDPLANLPKINGQLRFLLDTVEQWSSGLRVHWNHLVDFSKHRLLGSTTEFRIQVWRRGQEFVSSKFPGEADTAGWETAQVVPPLHRYGKRWASQATLAVAVVLYHTWSAKNREASTRGCWHFSFSN